MKRTLRQLIRRAVDFARPIEQRDPPELRLALEKRELERQLRAKGFGRKAATAAVAERFRNRG